MRVPHRNVSTSTLKPSPYPLPAYRGGIWFSGGIESLLQVSGAIFGGFRHSLATDPVILPASIITAAGECDVDVLERPVLQGWPGASLMRMPIRCQT